MSKKYCNDCALPATYHIQTWVSELEGILLPPLKLPWRLKLFFDSLFEKIFTYIGLIEMKDDFLFSDIQMRSACFIKEAKKLGIKFKAAKGPIGYTNYFCAEVKGRRIRFEGLPIADHINASISSLVDNKEKTKEHLKVHGFPVAPGKSFLLWQKDRAVHYGVYELGFPLVVKPRSGSVARHVTTNIQDARELRRAIHKAIIYSPAYIVERYVENSFVHRATVIDFNFVAVVTQIPARVIGDDNCTIQELVEKKNSDPRRGELHQKDCTVYKIVIDDTTLKLLTEKNYTMQTIPKKDEVVYLQENPFLRLGGDIEEVTENVHPDTIQLCKDAARSFDIRVVGIDFLLPDIESSWKDQNCTILELNSLPCIEMHHFPSSGAPQDVAGALVDLFSKYYL